MIFKVLLDRLAAFITRLIIDSVIYKADKLELKNYQIVMFSVKDGMLALENNLLTSKFAIGDKAMVFARAALAQHTIVKYSPYSLIENPVTYICVPKLSLCRVGFRRLRKFVRDWKGQSLFGEVEVIKYKMFWDM